MQAQFGMDRTNRNAALLLMKVRMIAIDEVYLRDPESPSCSSGQMTSLGNPPSLGEDSDASFVDQEIAPSTPKLRCRAVSVCSLDLDRSPSLSPSSVRDIFTPQEATSTGSILSSDETLSDQLRLSPTELKGANVHLTQLPFNPSNKFVGDKIPGPVRAVLRKKFSWKSYPELEDYLVKNRQEYLEYSSSLNYTAEQKRYNNTLTQGLLDLAADAGYVFEGFTFAAVRDRIRCYYKSYVQAAKKKKRKSPKKRVNK